jgi:hypothetical protein
MSLLNLDAVEAAPLHEEPFTYFVAQGFVGSDAKADLGADFPRISQAGLFPMSILECGPSFDALVAELQGPRLASALGRKLGVALEGLPTLVTVRGRCRQRDGKIHTDSTWKVVSALLYLNDGWERDGGRLRLLRSDDLEDVATEVPPDWGTLLAFKRCDRSFHGHKPYEGQRRVIQINWCTSQAEIDREISRHRRSAQVKRFFAFAGSKDYEA